MPKLIDDKIVDYKALYSIIGKKVRRYVDDYQDKNNTTRDAVSKKVGVSQGRLSQLLWSWATNDENMYKKILSVCGYKPALFEEIKQQAIQEHFGIQGWEQDFDYELSSDLGNNPDAVKEVMGFMDFVKQKYWIKK